MPVRKKPEIPLYWRRLFDELEELDIPTEIIGVEVRVLVKEGRGRASRGRHAFLPSGTFLRVLLRSSAPVFLCVEYGFATLVAAAIARLRGRRTIVLQENGGHDGLRLPGWKRRYRRLLGALVHGFVANTDSAYDELIDILGQDPTKIFRATVLVPPERAFLSRRAGPVPEPAYRPLFLFVGRLLKLKNVGGLLDAAAVLNARGFEFEMWIVGDGPRRDALEHRAGKLRDAGVVRFLGSWPNTAIGAVYEIADVFVMPSFRDYRSVAVLEALRFGKPVIDSVRDGNAGDFVRHEKTGLIFDPYKPGALEAAMERAITEIDTTRKFGQRASELMMEQTPRTAAAALRDVLEAVQTR
jgi:glycosyltransferase involved in cell wall biosynthesis